MFSVVHNYAVLNVALERAVVASASEARVSVEPLQPEL